MCYNEYFKNLVYYRVDHISNMVVVELAATPITSLKGFESGINYKVLATSLPYMYTDMVENVEFIAKKSIIDQIVDWFGNEIRIIELDEENITVSLKASPNAMEHWAMQYINYVEITKPTTLRGKIKENLKVAGEKYR